MLRRGELFGIFPEGTRSRDGYLHKGRTGAARLAMKLGCPIFPVGVIGTDEIQPPDAKVPKLFSSCQIKIGRPIGPERYRGRGAEHIAWRSDDRRGDVRDPRAHRPGVRQHVRRYDSGDRADASLRESRRCPSRTRSRVVNSDPAIERELTLVAGELSRGPATRPSDGRGCSVS